MCSTIDNLIDIPVISPGEKIHHYTTLAGLKGIVENKKFWVTKSDFLNDKSEFKIANTRFEEMLKEQITNEGLLCRFLDAYWQEVMYLKEGRIDQENIHGYYVISFSMDEDSILLWSEYSDFLGYSMKFDFQKLLDAFENKVFAHGKVIYDQEEQKKCLFSTFEKTVLNIEEYGNIKSIEDFNTLEESAVISKIAMHCAVWCEIYNMFFKQSCFEQENEYRFVFSCFHKNPWLNQERLQEMQFKIKDETLIPYVEERYHDGTCLESVTVGPKNNSDIAVKGLEYFFAMKGMDVAVKQSEMPLRY